MRGRFDIGRLLIALALIVQIFAPVGSNAAVLRLAFDPLVDIIVCAQDQANLDRREGSDKVLAHRGDACGLCQLVAAGGYAPPPPLFEPHAPPPVPAAEPAWTFLDEAPGSAPVHEHRRARAPPALS
ncbi:MAG: DUF2946 family protein [Hyphomicrobiales bacterium]|nr:DUF2946 family protein [Hyphomicrobiales bacterium]